MCLFKASTFFRHKLSKAIFQISQRHQQVGLFEHDAFSCLVVSQANLGLFLHGVEVDANVLTDVCWVDVEWKSVAE